MLGAGQGPSTVDDRHHASACGRRSPISSATSASCPRFAYRLASRSAAGGLRMVTVGPRARADRRSGAPGRARRRRAAGRHVRVPADRGGRRAASTQLAPDILLLAGGTDGGNSEVILHNADALGRSRLACPIVLAGNRERRWINAANGSPARALIVTENVMPEFNVLNIEPARARDPPGVHRPHRARQGHRPRAGDVRPRADADAGGGDGRRAAAGRRLRRGGGARRAAGRRSRRRDHRRALDRRRRAAPGGRDSAGPARAARQAHGRRRPRHAPQHRGRSSKRRAPAPSPPTAVSRRRACGR